MLLKRNNRSSNIYRKAKPVKKKKS